MISDKATRCPKCGNVVIKERPSVLYEEEDQKSGFMKYLPYILGTVAVLGIAGYFLFNHSSTDSSNEDNGANTVAVDTVSTKVDSSERSSKEEITLSLEKLFDDVMKGDSHEYDERYFSSDFNRIYNEVDAIDKQLAQDGLIGFWDFGFWDMAQNDVEMDIALNDVYIIEDDKAMAKVTFKFSFGGQTETRKEEIKVVLENGKWVLDDIHGYKKQMKEFIKENKDYQPSDDMESLSDDYQDVTSARSSSSNNSYRFSTAYDVIGYLADKSFYNGNRCLRIRENGVWFNDMCVTGAPTVERFESWKALIRAYTPTGQRFSYLIDPVNGQVTDDTGDIFTLR